MFQNVFILFAFIVAVEGCTHTPDDLFNVEIIHMNTNFQFDRHDNIHNSTLHLTYEWDVLKPYHASFDGYLFKILDIDANYNLVSETDEGFYVSGYDPKACVGINNKMWAADENSEPVLCDLPCEKYFPPVCNYSKVCTFLRINYIPLDHTKRSLRFAIKFGRVYDFQLVPYKNWHLGKILSIEGSRLVRYCREELISNHNVSHDDAYEFCSRNNHIGETAGLSGPPSRFEKYKVVKNLTTNRADVTYRWKRPYDISPNASLVEFEVNARRGTVPNQYIKISNQTGLDMENNEYYTTTITGIEFDEQNWIEVTPYLKKINCTEYCYSYGLGAREYFQVEDIDACTNESGVGPYCAVEALCRDMGSISSKSAVCTCPNGLLGNGISTSFDEGTGCYSYHNMCAVNHENNTCDAVAMCIELPPDYRTATCSCPMHYFGDGFRHGTGCSNRTFVIGLAVGLPLALIVCVLFGYFVLKYRNTANKGVRVHEENL